MIRRDSDSLGRDLGQASGLASTTTFPAFRCFLIVIRDKVEAGKSAQKDGRSKGRHDEEHEHDLRCVSQTRSHSDNRITPSPTSSLLAKLIAHYFHCLSSDSLHTFTPVLLPHTGRDGDTSAVITVTLTTRSVGPVEWPIYQPA